MAYSEHPGNISAYGDFMQTNIKTKKTSRVIAAVFLLAGIAVSCATTGSFLPLSPEDVVVGTIQAHFVARKTLNSREAVNMQAYIKLTEAAHRQYGQDTQFEIRDIIWVSGRDFDVQNTEYAATGKVVRVP
jgi:spore maturation protein CgeB